MQVNPSIMRSPASSSLSRVYKPFCIAFLVGVIPISFAFGSKLYWGTTSFNILLTVFALIGAVASLLGREKSRNKMVQRRLFAILMDDDFFQEYATISCVSVFYSLFKGALLGVSIGFVQVFVAKPIFYADYLIRQVLFQGIKSDFSLSYEYLLYSLFAFLLIIPMRIFMEDYLILVNAAKGIMQATSRFANNPQEGDK